jgi:chromate transport protein ChrA
MLVLSVLYEEITIMLGSTATPALSGLTASVAGILVATIYRLAKPTVTTVMGVVVAVAACSLGIVLRINPAWLVLTAGILGILMPQWFTREETLKTKAAKSKEARTQP